MYLHMRNAVKRSYQSVDSPGSATTTPPSSTQEKMSEDEPPLLPPCEVFGNLNQGMCAAHASSLSPQTAYSELSHLTQALGPQNLRRRNFPVVEEETNRPLYTVLDPNTKFDRERSRITALSYNDSGELVLADAGNAKVKVFSPQGQLKVECNVPVNLGALREPSGVCCAPSGEIVVADKLSGDLKVFTKDGHYLTAFGSELKRPSDVVINKNGQVIAVVEGSKNMFIFDKIGHEEFRKISGEVTGGVGEGMGSVGEGMGSVREGGQGEGGLSVGVSDGGQIVIGDEAGKSLIVYDSSGKFMSEYRSESSGSKGSVRRPMSLLSSYTLGHLKQPTSVANDHHGNVMVVDAQAGRISQFDVVNNAFLRQVVTREDGVDQPRRVAVSRSGQLAVTEVDSDSLKIYDVKSLLSWS